jgi:cell division septation protein DedD
MRNNETGEFELVVGDRQLLSAFFIVVLLCAVAFAMGYVVGQNAPRSGKITADSTPPSQPANAADSRPQPLAPAQSAAPPAAAPADNPAAPADSSPQPTTQPSQGAAPATAAQPAAQAPAAQAAPPKQAEPPASNTPVAPEDLPGGNYWQVMAVAQQQAEMLRTTLKDHGFSVYLSPGSKGLIRVLVGPYPDTQSFGKAKGDLEGAGMHPLRYKP